jgi:hypothetical protein
MIYAGTKPEIEAKRKAFIRKWRLKGAARIVPTRFLPNAGIRIVRKKSYRSIVPVRRIFFWRSNMP